MIKFKGMRHHPVRLIVLCGLILIPLTLKCQVTFIVEKIPIATPSSDSIFLTGTFNDWEVRDTSYLLRRLPSGLFSVTVPVDTGVIEYKFTRGNWMKTETNDQNQHLPNRTIKAGEAREVYISIENWQDLGGAQNLPIIVFYYFSIAFQAVLLIVLAGRIQRRDDMKFKLLIYYNVLIAVFFAGVVWYCISNLAIHTLLIALGQTLFLLLGPVTLIFLRLFYKGSVKWLHAGLLGIPAFLALIVSLVRMDGGLGFLNAPMSSSTPVGDFYLVMAGLVYNLIILIYCSYRFGFRLISFFDLDHKDRFLDVFTKVKFLVVAMVATNLLLVVFGGYEATFFVDFHLPLITFSFIVFVELYYMWRYPAILKEVNRFMVDSEDAEFIQEKLIGLMTIEKVFKDPELSLQSLSEILQTKPHVLSRVLNDYFHQNFRDYVNQYRIREFIREAEEEQKIQTFTYLALAMEVGFNSKSTFNLAFKRVMGRSPREYFKNSQ